MCCCRFYDDVGHDLHHDQFPPMQGLHAYQGAIYLEAAELDDYCFMVIAGSHKYYTEYFKHFSGGKGNNMVTAEGIKWFEEQGCVVKRIAVPQGGLVLWDARTAHCGAPPLTGRKNPGRHRCVLIQCMGPAIWATEDDIKRKKEGYDKLQNSHHWPSEKVTFFDAKEKEPTKYDVVEMPAAGKTEEAMFLCGLKQYNFKDGKPNGPEWMPKWD
jgi:hypothetical protein